MRSFCVLAAGFDFGNLLPIIIAVVGIIIILSVILSMWKKVPQDRAAVVTGLKKRIITGGGGIVVPVFERVDYISLGNLQIDVSTDESMSSQGVPIAVIGTAVIKVKNEQKSIFNATSNWQYVFPDTMRKHAVVCVFLSCAFTSGKGAFFILFSK